jgi:hypothetical protein
VTTDGIDFVDEDDAGRVLLGLLEHVAHAACADADEHFDEVRTRDGEERHVGFARDGARQKRLTRTGRADEQHAARNTAAKALEFLRIAQEFDDFLKVLLGFVHAGNVCEGNAAMRFGQKLGLGLAEAHRAARAALHLPHEEQPDAEDQEHGQQRADIAEEAGRAVRFRTRADDDILGLDALDERVVTRRGIGLEGRAGLDIAADDLLAGDHHFLHPARVDLFEELRIGDFPRAGLGRARLEHAEQRDQQEGDDRPQGEVTEIGIHRTFRVLSRPGCPGRFSSA